MNATELPDLEDRLTTLERQSLRLRWTNRALIVLALLLMIPPIACRSVGEPRVPGVTSGVLPCTGQGTYWMRDTMVIPDERQLRLRTFRGVVSVTLTGDAPVDGVNVTVREWKTGALETYTTLTDRKGRFDFSGLPWGYYEFFVCKEGFFIGHGFVRLARDAGDTDVVLEAPGGILDSMPGDGIP